MEHNVMNTLFKMTATLQAPLQDDRIIINLM